MAEYSSDASRSRSNRCLESQVPHGHRRFGDFASVDFESPGGFAPQLGDVPDGCCSEGPRRRVHSAAATIGTTIGGAAKVSCSTGDAAKKPDDAAATIGGVVKVSCSTGAGDATKKPYHDVTVIDDDSDSGHVVGYKSGMAHGMHLGYTDGFQDGYNAALRRLGQDRASELAQRSAPRFEQDPSRPNLASSSPCYLPTTTSTVATDTPSGRPFPAASDLVPSASGGLSFPHGGYLYWPSPTSSSPIFTPRVMMASDRPDDVTELTPPSADLPR